jgi:hypothetical protein
MKFKKSLKIGWFIIFISTVLYTVWSLIQDTFDSQLLIIIAGLIVAMPFKSFGDFNLFKKKK